jgi:hypothetical protein
MPTTDLGPYSSSPLSLRRRPEVIDARDARRPGANALVRTQAGYLIARHGLACTEKLTRQEVEVCRRQGPLVDDRAREIVDTYVESVKTTLARLSLQGE